MAKSYWAVINLDEVLVLVQWIQSTICWLNLLQYRLISKYTFLVVAFTKD
jgi:hypothetical protein